MRQLQIGTQVVISKLANIAAWIRLHWSTRRLPDSLWLIGQKGATRVVHKAAEIGTAASILTAISLEIYPAGSSR
jgi:hypothetical protein